MKVQPEVSVVITAVNRPRELDRAIASVLTQSFQDFEIVVVLDGPGHTIDVKHVSDTDGRIRVVVLAENVGLAEARNRGIRASRGKWIALLDDDDEWLAEKLQIQVQVAATANCDFVFVPCRFMERTVEIDRIMPERLPSTPERFSEYIYCEHGYLQPSMYFFSRSLGLTVPFTKGLRHVEDSDWMLRMSQWPGVVIMPAEECLSVYYNYKHGERESETTPWETALNWGITNHHLFTKRAFPYFVARLCLNARRSGEPVSVLWRLLGVARQYGRITPRVFAYFLSYWFVPPGSLRNIRGLVLNRQRPFVSKADLTACESVPLGGQSC